MDKKQKIMTVVAVVVLVAAVALIARYLMGGSTAPEGAPDIAPPTPQRSLN